MGPTKVRIFLDHVGARYSPGDRISGKLLLILEREKQILGIDMNLIGKTKVSCISADKRSFRRSQTRGGTSSDKYFIVRDSKSLRRQDENGEETQKLPAGTYEYPFSWILPENVPASFEGPYGWVRYRLEVIVKSSFWDHSCEAEAQFFVTGNYDLNILDKVFREVKVDSKWIYVYNQYGATYLELTFELERRAFVPGDVIRFAATPSLQNQLGHPPIQGVKVSFVQEQTYKIQDKVRRHATRLQQLTGPAVFCNNIEVWNDSIGVLAVQPTALGGGCRFIDVQYYLKVSINITENDKIDFSIKLQIGTIPLQRRVRRAFDIDSRDESLQSQLSIEIPSESPVSRSPERSPSTSRGQASLQPMMDFLSVQPGPSRRASAPPLWLESEVTNVNQPGIESDNADGQDADGAGGGCLETPPPKYSDAVFFGSEGFLETNRATVGVMNGTPESDDPPEYQRQPPIFLRKGARHLYDSCNAYATL